MKEKLLFALLTLYFLSGFAQSKAGANLRGKGCFLDCG